MAALGALWFATVASGMAVILDYESRPGPAARPPTDWPSGTQVARIPGRATLVMLAHPHCPCTRASVGELARLMAHVQGRLTATVLFLSPSSAPIDWEQTDLWQSAAAIPSVAVRRDVDGVEAARFGAVTSGQVIVYDAAGGMVFSGGITGGRGHAGDNAGRSAILALVDGEPSTRESPVFGCSLVTPTS
jgi:hypothetical protein